MQYTNKQLWKGVLCGVMAFGLITGVMVARAKADERAKTMICPSPIDPVLTNWDQCHTVEPGKQVSFNLNLGMPSDFMARVCDPNGHDCYTGYVDMGQFQH